MKRVLWTSAISAVLTVALVALFAHADGGGVARADPPATGPAVDGWPEDAPTRAPSPTADRPAPTPDARRANGGGDDRPVPSAPDVDRGSLQTIGTLAAAHYFQTYLNLGFLADGKEKGVYSDQDAREVLRSVLSVLDSVDGQLEALGKRPLGKEDRDSLEQMRAISALLRQQGKELQAYWDGGRAEDADHFESLRQHSYAAIRRLMGIGG
jgi:hypothetical protein